MYKFAVYLTPAKGAYVVDVWADSDPDSEMISEMQIDQFRIPRYGSCGGDPFAEWVRLVGRVYRAREERDWL